MLLARVYWPPAGMLKEFFPGADRFEPVSVPATGHEAEYRERMGARPSQTGYVIQRAVKGGETLGWVFIDNEIGEHEPITFAVKIDPAGRVLRQEVMAYRESRGDEVRSAGFRNQFPGKGPGDPLYIGHDIAGIAGASYSSRAMAAGVRRALLVWSWIPGHRGAP